MQALATCDESLKVWIDIDLNHFTGWGVQEKLRLAMVYAIWWRGTIYTQDGRKIIADNHKDLEKYLKSDEHLQGEYEKKITSIIHCLGILNNPT